MFFAMSVFAISHFADWIALGCKLAPLTFQCSKELLSMKPWSFPHNDHTRRALQSLRRQHFRGTLQKKVGQPKGLVGFEPFTIGYITTCHSIINSRQMYNIRAVIQQSIQPIDHHWIVSVSCMKVRKSLVIRIESERITTQKDVEFLECIDDGERSSRLVV